MSTSTEEPIKQTLYARAKAWGDSSLPPALLATLIFPLHARPFQTLPMLFPPLLLFTSYINLAGFKRDAAGASAAWSGLYVLLAARRGGGTSIVRRFGTRGIIRGAAMGLGLVNVVGGGVAYVTGEKGRVDKWIGKEDD